MKIRKKYITIGLVGVLTTLLHSAAMSSGQPPGPKEKNQLMSEEETAHKIWLFKHALPHHDIVQGQIAPTLHATNGKTFTCPTVEELQRGVFKNTGDQNGGKEIKEFESNGIYFTSIEFPPANAKFNSTVVEFHGPKEEIEGIICRYNAEQMNYRVEVSLDKSLLKESLITFSQDDTKLGKRDERAGSGDITFKKRIEFTVQPVTKK